MKYKSLSLHAVNKPYQSFSNRLPAPCPPNDSVAVCHSMQVGNFKINNRLLAGAKRSFPSEAAYYSLLYTYRDLRAKIHRDKNSFFALETQLIGHTIIIIFTSEKNRVACSPLLLTDKLHISKSLGAIFFFKERWLKIRMTVFRA